MKIDCKGLGLGLDLVRRHAGRELDEAQRALAAVELEDAEVGDHQVDHALARSEWCSQWKSLAQRSGQRCLAD